MIVGVDAGPLVGQGGISGYVGPLVRSLLAMDTDTQYHLVLRRGWLTHPDAASLETLARVVPIHLPDRLLSFWWDHMGKTLPLRRSLWKSLDVFLSTCLIAPVLPQGKTVSIVYDLIPLRLPDLFPRHREFRAKLERLLHHSSALVAISQRTKQDLVELMGVDPDLVDVVYPGRGDGFRPSPAPIVAEVASRFGLSEPYILYVGALGPHKNVETLLRAYQRARLNAHLPAKLVIVGSHHWGRHAMSVLESLHVRNDIVLTGYVPVEDLPALYTGAELFVFPSSYEGFGLPVLEAMACGTPVIAANSGSLPEAGGSAALYVDPMDEDALAATMCRVMNEPETRARMCEASLEHASRFSWTQSAWDLLRIIRRTAGTRTFAEASAS